MLIKELYEYLKEHKEEQSYSPVRLPFDVELELVDKFLELYEKVSIVESKKDS